MTKNQNIDSALGKLQTTLRNNPATIDIHIPSRIKSQKDLQKLLEILTATNDINLQIKIFLVLSACSLSDDKYLVIIIKFRALYDKISNAVQTGLPGKAVHAINFLCSLLQVEDEDDTPNRRKLAQYVKDKVRTTGCLGTLMNNFNSVMYLDTRNALCQCIAAACNNCDTNQTYCSLLIPLCIQMCSSKNKTVFIVLQNLLRNHHANLQMFVESNGFSIFTKELLQYEKCMQLLRTVVVQYRDAPQLLVRQALVLSHLRDFVRIYGCGSEIGHKATIILHHIDSRVTVPNSGNISNYRNKNISSNKVQTEKKDENKRETRAVVDLDDTAILMRNIAREVSNFNVNEARGNPITKANNSVLQNIFAAENQKKKLDQSVAPDSRTEQKRQQLQSNIAQEPSLHRNNQHRIRAQRKIITRKSSSNFKGNQRQHQPKELHRNISIEPSFSFLENENRQQRTKIRPPSDEQSFSFLENKNPLYNDMRSQKPHSRISVEPSFSFLVNINNRQQRYMNREQEPTKKMTESSDKNRGNDRKQNQHETSNDVAIEPSFSFLENQNYKPVNKKTKTTNELNTDLYVTAKENLTNMSKNDSKSSTPGSEEFDPVFSSTFVHERTKRKHAGNSTQSKTAKRRCVKNRSHNISREPENDGDMSLRNTSLGSRIFDALNNSCTSIVKSVTSIFRKKKTEDSFRASVSPKNDTCSFSFLNEVNKIEAQKSILPRKRSKDSLYSNGSESCDTCDDTQELKKKLRTDETLRQTVKKLKMGINMFGCDFKKISRTMWPRDTYMKPEVLYKLYRKLLVK